jgi:hypothetical protein
MEWRSPRGEVRRPRRQVLQERKARRIQNMTKDFNATTLANQSPVRAARRCVGGLCCVGWFVPRSLEEPVERVVGGPFPFRPLGRKVATARPVRPSGYKGPRAPLAVSMSLTVVWLEARAWSLPSGLKARLVGGASTGMGHPEAGEWRRRSGGSPSTRYALGTSEEIDETSTSGSLEGQDIRQRVIDLGRRIGPELTSTAGRIGKDDARGSLVSLAKLSASGLE